MYFNSLSTPVPYSQWLTGRAPDWLIYQDTLVSIVQVRFINTSLQFWPLNGMEKGCWLEFDAFVYIGGDNPIMEFNRYTVTPSMFNLFTTVMSNNGNFSNEPGIAGNPENSTSLAFCERDPCSPFYWHGLTLIPAWISNHMPNKMWDDITYPFLNFNSCTVEV